MGKVRVAVTIDAAPEVVWSEVEQLERHVDWMADAEEIRFQTEATRGEDVRFECDTKVGPIRLTDLMEVTEWVEGRSIGVRHVGVVTGTGRFTLTPARGGGTRFVWEEQLRYPWWLGAAAGGLIGDRIMAQVWKGNLRRLKAVIEG